ncbi:MAG: hydrophobe/amphiphile efflux-1 family RND transporter [Verrucomicrobia bacterium]|nr:MAG: hydrophobe/amphiphile efflux-1 family RND transporter [Verrucomicrobiota bacterium]
MKFSHFFIDRPIFASVVSIIITLLGIVGYVSLPVTQYPEIVPPTISVTLNYPGASPEILMNTAIAPLEQEINGVENMMYMSSQCNADGSASINVTFELGTNIDIAQVQVQNRVSMASSRLPEEVRNIGVVVKKRSPDMLVAVNLVSPDGSRDKIYMTNYAITQMNDRLARIYGVSDITVFGSREYSMRIWLNPDRLDHFNMTASQVVAALREQNKQVAAGKINQPPISSPDAAHELIINTQGRLTSPEEFERIIIRYTPDGKIVQLKDVARIELGSYTYSDDSYMDASPAVTMAIYQLPGTNALHTVEVIRKTLEEMKADFPAGMDYYIAVDNTEYIRASVDAVYHTIFEAVLLVVLVMMVFLQDWRAAVIPLFAIPVSLIGTFFFMSLFGFSINNLSLFGLVLAIGIVVDDAIVVVENVERNLRDGLEIKEATKKAMTQVQGALIAIVLVLSSVFIPTAFIEGISGQFYRQFALTIAVSTILSGVVSLTLSPALCALMMKPQERPDTFSRAWNFLFGWFFRAFNAGFRWISEIYGRFVRVIVKLWAPMFLLYALMLAFSVYLFDITPKGFIPKQDTGYVFCTVQLPDGAALDHTDSVMKKIVSIIRTFPDVDTVMSVVGLNGATFGKASNAGAIFMKLHPKSERLKKGLHLDSFISGLSFALMKQVPEASTFVLTPPAVNGIGAGGDFKAMVQDRTGKGINAVEECTRMLAMKSMQDPAVSLAFTTFRVSSPQLYVDIDRERAQKLNVPISSIFETMQFNLGSVYVNDFNILNRVYRVMAQAEGGNRSEISDIYKLKVPNVRGVNVPLGSVADVKRTIGPERVGRYNLYPAAELMGNCGIGYSTGQSMAAIEKIAKENLPAGMDIEWTDLAFQEKRVGNTSIYIFGMCVLFVFLLLSALYESWKLPLSVILVVPLVLLFAISGVLLRGMDNNIMTQVGFVVLIGLACKNAILIVEFAKQRQERGEEVVSAVSAASKNRLRPILMTSFAFILGVVPLAYGTGSGSELRQALGTSVFFGMLGVTILGLLFTPVFFYVIRRGYKPALPEK